MITSSNLLKKKLEMKEHLKISRIRCYICISVLKQSYAYYNILHSTSAAILDFQWKQVFAWVDSSALFCVVRDTSKEPISGETALLALLSTIGAFLVLIFWRINCARQF